MKVVLFLNVTQNCLNRVCFILHATLCYIKVRRGNVMPGNMTCPFVCENPSSCFMCLLELATIISTSNLSLFQCISCCRYIGHRPVMLAVPLRTFYKYSNDKKKATNKLEDSVLPHLILTSQYEIKMFNL